MAPFPNEILGGWEGAQSISVGKTTPFWCTLRRWESGRFAPWRRRTQRVAALGSWSPSERWMVNTCMSMPNDVPYMRIVRSVSHIAGKDWKEVHLGLGYFFPVGWSDNTGYNPAQATWHHPQEGYSFQWEVVDPIVSQPQAGWIDPQFPHDNFSLGDPGKVRVADAVWIRAIDLCKEPVLFGVEEPADALQGSVGNCSMIGALAALAEFPGYLSSLFINTGDFGRWQVQGPYVPPTLVGNINRKKRNWERLRLMTICHVLRLPRRACCQVQGPFLPNCHFQGAGKKALSCEVPKNSRWRSRGGMAVILCLWKTHCGAQLGTQLGWYVPECGALDPGSGCILWMGSLRSWPVRKG